MNDLKCIEKIQEEFSCQCPSTICRYGIINKYKKKKELKFYFILLVNNQIIDFIESFCPEENLQGFNWTKTLINKGQYLSCPTPCIGIHIIFIDYSFQSSFS